MKIDQPYLSRQGYEAIKTYEDEENCSQNGDFGNNSSIISGNGSIPPPTSKYLAYSYISLFFSLFLVILFILSPLLSFNPTLSQPYLIKPTPFKPTIHPDPPTALWGQVAKPYPTGAFWTNLVVKNGDGPVAVYPYGVKCLENGIQVSYGAARRVVSKIAITDGFGIDLQISATQTYVSRTIESYDNISVTMSYRVGAGGKYKAPLVKASPFITVIYDGATPYITSPHLVNVEAKVFQGVTGSVYVLTLGGGLKYMLYCSEPVFFVWKDNSLAPVNPLKGVVRVAVLSPKDPDGALNALLPYMPRYPTGGQVSLSYPASPSATTAMPSQATLTITYSTAGGGAAGSLLMFALPHHVPLLSPALQDSDDSKKVAAALGDVWCVKGRLRPVVGDSWKLVYPLPPVSWHYAVADKLSTQQLEEVAKQLLWEVKTPISSSADVYAFGKQIGRMARLALIADYLGIADARQQALLSLETSLLPWLGGVGGDTFLYDKTYGGLISQQSLENSNFNFGAGYYNDHHFHYGYYIYAGAVWGKLDSPLFEQQRATLDSFVRDVCNYDAQDVDFPIFRHKDWFDGHSWASGLFQQANGKGQESSSESINAYYSCALYGMVTSNMDLQKHATAMLAMEIQATLTYYHMGGDGVAGQSIDAGGLYDPLFVNRRILGNMGGLDVTTSTWFGDDIAYVHGINMMPLTPATALLYDASYVTSLWPILSPTLPPLLNPDTQNCAKNARCSSLNLTGLCCPTAEGVFLLCCSGYEQGRTAVADEWRALVYAALAVLDRDTAWTQLLALPSFGSGNSRANSLLWAASRALAPSSMNLSLTPRPLPNDADLVPAKCAANSACDALGLAGDCCPNTDGIFLACCPRV